VTAENFTEKLNRLYSQKIQDPTPVQIQKKITENCFLSDLSNETGITNMFLLKSVFHPDGKPMTYKAKNFKESLKNFLDSNPDAVKMLSFIDERCIREKSGKLITRRIIKRFNSNND